MADNFLEKKMEELHRGSFSQKPRYSSAPRKGFIQFPFPPRNVIISDIDTNVATPIIELFIKQNCKVAFISSDTETGNKLAYSKGVRFISASPDQPETMMAAFDNVIKAWREVDIVISSGTTAHILSEKWEKHIKQFPILRPYGGRLFIVNSSNKETVDILTKTLATHSITVNSFQLSENDIEKISAITPIIMTLSLQSSAPISGLLI